MDSGPSVPPGRPSRFSHTTSLIIVVSLTYDYYNINDKVNYIDIVKELHAITPLLSIEV